MNTLPVIARSTLFNQQNSQHDYDNQDDPSNPANQFFQCDCACAESAFAFSTTPINFAVPLGHPPLHTQEMPGGNSLMFNPYRSEGIAVLNPPAREIWQTFSTPRRLQDASASGVFVSTALQLAQAGLLEPMSQRAPPRRSQPQTLSAWVHVTNECNLRCDYCYIHKSGDDMDEATGRAAVDAVLRSAQNHGFKRIKLKFAGGEATMNLPRVFDIHAYATECAAVQGFTLDTVILSNGVSIGERSITEIMARGIRVSISLDGVGETHDAQRKFANGQGSFRWVNRTIDKLVARGVHPFISITLTNRTARGLAETIKWVIERDLPFNINFFRDNDCAASFDDLKLKDDAIIEGIQHAFAEIESHLPRRSLLGCLVDRAQFDQPHDKTCSVGDSYLVIDHAGNVAKCQMEIERPVTTILAEDPLAIVRADKAGLQNLSVEEKEGCKTCEWKYWCAGGCPALTFRATGRFDVKSPNCRIYKAIYPQLLRLEGLRLMQLHQASFSLN
jgi:uncharacterized protein